MKLCEWGTTQVSSYGSSPDCVRFFQIGSEVSFRDTIQFFQQSLESLANTATPKELKKFRENNINIISSNSYLD